jgi:hypothetical protein
MNQNLHVINFQNLKQFFKKKYFPPRGMKLKNESNCDNSRAFGVAYHKIVEQDPSKIQTIVKKSAEFDKIIKNFNLTDNDKVLLLKMVKKFYYDSNYRKYILNSAFVHKEQNLYHFITKKHLIFRLEAIIDAIVSSNGKEKIILDYKTVNNTSLIDRAIEINFYWLQLLFYKYIYENSVQNNGKHDKIEDLYLLFQSKSSADNHEIVLKKFSDLSSLKRRTIERNFYISLENYINTVVGSYSNKSQSLNLANNKKFKKQNQQSLLIQLSKRLFRLFLRSMNLSLISGFSLQIYQSKYYINSIKEGLLFVTIFVFIYFWLVLTK